MAETTEEQKMLKGEMFRAFTPELINQRDRCAKACNRLNNVANPSRRQIVELWRQIQYDETPLPPKLEDPDADVAQFGDDPWIVPPIRMDYGKNVKLGKEVFLNFNCTFIDTCMITIGSRTLVGPNVSFYSGSHPLDPVLRNGMKGPEYGKEIDVGEDCWLGGHVIILPGVSLGYGVVVGAGSVVTKSVPELHVVAGNPARIIKQIPRPTGSIPEEDGRAGAETHMADLAKRIEFAITPS